MTSDAQIAANIQNARLSTGPTSAAGKRRTSLNAHRHGLTGQIHLATPIEQAAFDAHCKSIHEALAPVGSFESDLAQSIAENRWRIICVHALEAGIFAPGDTEESAQSISEPISQARIWLAKSDQLQLLAVYERRIHRSIERNMAELRTLRASRKAALLRAVEEAQLVAQHAQTKGEKCDPAPGFPANPQRIGFDFSNGEIARMAVRNQRLTEARKYAKQGKPVIAALRKGGKG